METVVVTRHAALVEYLQECGLVAGEVEVVEHADVETVKDRHVIGVLPLWLASHAALVTEVPLKIPPELRGQELDLEQLRQYAGTPATYEVIRIEG